MRSAQICSLFVGLVGFLPLTYSLSAYLDSEEKLKLEWEFNHENVTFTVTAKTTGWFGIGLSPNGGMPGSDIYTMWVKNGQTYIQDRHADAFALPHIDDSQDITLVSGTEENGETTVIFTRKLNTCDNQDWKITDDTMRVIWAMSQDGSDPSGDHPTYHGAKRGGKSLYLRKAVHKHVSMPSDTIIFDAFNPNVTLPTRRTYYHCQLFKPPQLKDKHHMIKYEPIINPKHLGVVHHMILYGCYDDFERDFLLNRVDISRECYHSATHKLMKICRSPVAVWAIGGDEVTMPAEAGFPVGVGVSPTYYVLETHYDNVKKDAGLVDDSGLRLTLTKELRKYDSGVIEAGDIAGIFIPPGSPDAQSSGFCTSKCTKALLPAEGVNVFGMFLHGHLAATKVIARHFRDGKEIEPLDADLQYDFNYQQYKMKSNYTKLMPGDDIMVTCHYNTVDRNTWTLGGLSSLEEMCLAFVFYYPATQLSLCRTSVAVERYASDYFARVFGISGVNSNNLREKIGTPGFWTPDMTAKQGDAYRWFTHQDRCMAFGRKYPLQGSSAFYTPISPARLPFSRKDDDTCPTDVPSKPTIVAPSTAPNTETPTKVLPVIGQLSAYLDAEENMLLEWEYTAETITFTVTAKTNGWFGIGLSPNGGMPGSDIYTMWVKDGQTYIQDRYATEFALPALDKIQNIKLISGEEKDGKTIVKFSRRHSTCDDQDSVIGEDTSRVIWAMSADNTDPVGDNPTYHGAINRGSRSIYLRPQQQIRTIPSDAFTFDLNVNDVEIPPVDTMYHCELMKPPKPAKKHHVIQYEPIIKKANLGIIHHMIVYGCFDKQSREHLFEQNNTKFDCFTGNMPALVDGYCKTIVFAWAIGGGAVEYPDVAGYPVGTPDSPDYYMIEIHYDNPRRVSGLKDSSGLRLTLTPTLRQYDSGVLQVGGIPGIAVPPGLQDFRTVSGCSTNCSKTLLPSDGVNLFGICLHGHTATHAVIARHFRSRQEMEYLDADFNYDFNYQQYKMFNQPKKLMPGDEVLVECSYNTMDRTQMTYGGLPSSSEMCLAFLFYYPAQNASDCSSIPWWQYDMKNFASHFYGEPMDNKRGTGGTTDYSLFEELTAQKNWTASHVATLEAGYTSAFQFETCRARNYEPLLPPSSLYFMPAEVRQKAVKPKDSSCDFSDIVG